MTPHEVKVREWVCTRGGEMEQDVEWKPGCRKFREDAQRYVKLEDYRALESRVKGLESLFQRHAAREKYMAEIVFQHIKHGDADHQAWLRRELVNVMCREDTKACITFDALSRQLADAQALTQRLELDVAMYRQQHAALRELLREAASILDLYTHGPNPNSPYKSGENPFYVLGSSEVLERARKALATGEEGVK